MRITSAGLVGIGTTSPAQALSIGGVSSTPGEFKGLAFQSGSTEVNYVRSVVQDGNNLALSFGTYNSSLSEKARLTADGKLLVGTSSSRTGVSTSYGPAFQVETTTYAVIQAINNSNDEFGTWLALGKSRGSAAGGTTIVQNGDQLGNIWFLGADGSDVNSAAAQIKCEVDGTPGADDMPGRLVFSTTADGSASPTERMRITNDGNLYIGKATDSYQTAGAQIFGAGGIYSTRSSATCYIANRLTDDGNLFEFYQANNIEGTISVSGATVSYNQFLGAHWAALTDWSRPEIKIGTILETINELTDWKYAVIEVEGEQKKICYNGTAEVGSTVTVEYEDEEYEGIVELETNPEFNKAVKVKVNDTAASKAVYGVFVGWNTDSNGDGGIWNDMYVGAVGNYVIRMAEGQEPEIGDLVEADGTGCAVVQSDDIIRTKTVAKITSTIPQVTYDDGSFLVTCVLYCG
jgi:hypothetical protein